MVRELYIGERILINQDNGKIFAYRISKEGPRLIDPKEMQFINDKAAIMEKLKSGSIVDISTDGTTVTSSIIGTSGTGLSIPTSVEDLEFKLNGRR